MSGQRAPKPLQNCFLSQVYNYSELLAAKKEFLNLFNSYVSRRNQTDRYRGKCTALRISSLAVLTHFADNRDEGKLYSPIHLHFTHKV